MGNLFDQKNIFLLIEVMEKLCSKTDRYELWIIGEGPLENKLKKEILKKQLQKNIKLLGRVECANEMYSAMDIFLLPSKFEGFGIVAIEAQASNLPTLISNKCPKNICINDNCYVLSIEDSDVWVKTIQSIKIDNANREKEIGEGLLYFDYRTTSKIMARIYKELIA